MSNTRSSSGGAGAKGGGDGGSSVKRRLSLQNKDRTIRIGSPISRRSSLTRNESNSSAAGLGMAPKYFFRVEGMLSDGDDEYYLGAKVDVVKEFYESDDPHRELRVSYAKMHSKFHRHPLRFCPKVSFNVDGDPTYGRCVVHVYDRDGHTWLGHLGINSSGILVVSHPPHDFLMKLAPHGVDVEDNTSCNSVVRENDRFLLKWLNPETDEWVTISSLRRYLRFRWRAGLQKKGRPLFCFVEDPEKLQNLEVELAKTEATDKQKLKAQMHELAELENAYEKLSDEIAQLKSEKTAEREAREKVENELAALQTKAMAFKSQRDEAELLLTREQRQHTIEVEQLSEELKAARSRVQSPAVVDAAPASVDASQNTREVETLSVADSSGRKVKYGRNELTKLLDQRRTLSTAVRTLQAQKNKLIEACKALQRKADESLNTQESLLKKISQLQHVGLQNEQLRHQVSNLERQLDRYRKAEEAAAAHKQDHGMQAFNAFFKNFGANNNAQNRK